MSSHRRRGLKTLGGWREQGRIDGKSKGKIKVKGDGQEYPFYTHKMRARGLKPALILGASRGAEAPLFRGTARICGFFRSL